MSEGPASTPSRTWVVVLGAALAVVLAGAALLAWQWMRVRGEVDELSTTSEQLSADLDAARSESQARGAVVEELRNQVVQLRIAYDPVVVEAIGFVQSQVGDTACTQATEAHSAGTAAPVATAVSAVVVPAAAAQRPVLAEVPGWEAKVDVAAVEQRIATCITEADQAAKAAAAKAKAAKEAASTMWCPLENRRVPKSYDRVCTEEEALADYDFETTCYQSSDPEACFRNGGPGD